MKTKSPIQVVFVGWWWKLTRPGAHYAVERRGDEHRGAWVPDGEESPEGWHDAFPENEARALLPFLRAVAHGRRASEPTTPDGKLISKACKITGLTVAGLAVAIRVDKSTLSRARHGELPAKHRAAIQAVIAAASG